MPVGIVLGRCFVKRTFRERKVRFHMEPTLRRGPHRRAIPVQIIAPDSSGIQQGGKMFGNLGMAHHPTNGRRRQLD